MTGIPGVDAYHAGGYFLTRRGRARERYDPAGLLPDQLLSLSGCLGEFAFEYWWNDENIAVAAGFSVPAERHEQLKEWYTDRFGRDLGAPTVAFSVGTIAAFLDEFVTDTTGLSLIGCGLAPERAAALLAEHRVGEGLGEYGVIEMLDREMPLEPGGRALGFEPMSYQYGLECSWICNGLHIAAATQLGIRPDPVTGLLASSDDAARVIDYIRRDDVGAEPGTWLPWLVVEYPIDR